MERTQTQKVLLILMQNEHFDVFTLLRLRLCSKQVANLVIPYIRKFPRDIERHLTDRNLLAFRHLTSLDASFNSKITDEGIKHMQLHTARGPEITK